MSWCSRPDSAASSASKLRGGAAGRTSNAQSPRGWRAAGVCRECSLCSYQLSATSVWLLVWSLFHPQYIPSSFDSFADPPNDNSAPVVPWCETLSKRQQAGISSHRRKVGVSPPRPCPVSVARLSCLQCLRFADVFEKYLILLQRDGEQAKGRDSMHPRRGGGKVW